VSAVKAFGEFSNPEGGYGRMVGGNELMSKQGGRGIRSEEKRGLKQDGQKVR